MTILLTTGTVTSARLMKQKLPPGVIHQYVPIDTPEATRRFMRHWTPEFAFWVESELWPNLIDAANRMECFMGIINARMSERSFQFWKKHPSMIQRMLGAFNYVFAQSKEDAERIKRLGAKNVVATGNLKFDAMPLACDESELVRLTLMAGERPLWLAASTHPGEEAMIAMVHSVLRTTHPQLLTVIVPRHPNRGAEIQAALKNGKSALRSKGEAILPDTSFYIADTMGELGLFYRLCSIAFMGGSLIRHGGQNPLEPARLSCSILAGPYVYNFADIYEDMRRVGACLGVKAPQELAVQVKLLLDSPATASALQDRAKHWVDSKSGDTAQLVRLMHPLFSSTTPV